MRASASAVDMHGSKSKTFMTSTASTPPTPTTSGILVQSAFSHLKNVERGRLDSRPDSRVDSRPAPFLEQAFIHRCAVDLGGSRTKALAARPATGLAALANMPQLADSTRPSSSTALPSTTLARPLATLSANEQRMSAFTRRQLKCTNKVGAVHAEKSLVWLAHRLPKPDPAYQHIISEAEGCDFGTGPVASWPLLHDELYVCRLSDMKYAYNLRDAYEVGLRGRKREQSTASFLKLLMEEGQPHAEPKKDTGWGPSTRITTITCDACGETLAGLNEFGFFPGSFYYCERCKKHGNRYELCASCHAVECAQGVGKHLRADPHPHFLGCSHNQLTSQRLLAGKEVPDVRRVFCDYCGQLAGHCDADDEVWTCPRCPEEHGVRFELCAPCHQDLGRRSDREGWASIF